MSKPLEVRDLVDADPAELSADERQQVAAFIASDADAAADQHFWNHLRGRLHTPPPAAPDASAAILATARARGLAPAKPALRLPTWIGHAVAACVGIIVTSALFLGLQRPDAPPTTTVAAIPTAPAAIPAPAIAPVLATAWAEDGSPVMPPSDAAQRPAVMPKSAAVTIAVNHAVDPGATAKPWLGVWIRPVDLIGDGAGATRGHLLVRVVDGSPAAAAGLRPGDIITCVDHCMMHTPLCLNNVLKTKHPGDTVTIEMWCARTGQRETRQATLQSTWE